MTADAIKNPNKSKALGPDQIAPLHLHYPGTHGISYLTKLINMSFNFSEILQNWKVGKTIPLLNPGEDPELSKSYRPIALLLKS